MYLKRMEILGFKSFKDKIKINFSTGVTAIVGPNGSGKSNIVDGIRWVLGEQNAKSLRGANMQDIIFSGAKGSKPLGLASVSLVFDNSDKRLAIPYEEVTVTRKLYRSGESEYQLNGATCRLKDITELFMDTGVGRDGYSIVGQGDIEQLLQNNQRRTVFEEATGINKHKTRKDLTVAKLVREEENLARLQDIIREVETQVPRLERASERAKTFLKLNEQLKLVTVNIFLKEEVALSAELTKTETNLNLISDQIRTEAARKEATEHKLSATKTESEQATQTLDKLNQQVFEQKIAHRDKQNTIPLYQEQIKNIQASIDRLAEKLADKTDLSEQLAEHETQRLALTNQLDTLSEQLSAKQTQLQTLTRDIAEVEALQQHHDQVQAKLSRSADNHQSPAVQAILSRRERFGSGGENPSRHNVEGTIGQLVSTDSQYQTALEIALGGAVNNVVVDTQATATNCINYLKQNRLGRATFLPLDTLTGRSGQPAPAGVGVIGLLTQLVTHAPAHAQVVQMLLGDVLIVDTLENATKLKGKTHRIVTLDGQTIAKSGAMTGGSVKERSETAKLNQTLAQLSSQLNGRAAPKLRTEKEALQEAITELKIAHNQLDNKRHFVEQAIGQLSQTQAQGEQNHQHITNQIAELEQEKQAKESAITAINSELEQAGFAADTLAYDISHAEKHKASLATLIQELEKEQQEQLKLGYDLQNELNRLQHMHNAISEKKQAMYTHLWETYEITQSRAKSYQNLYLPLDKLRENETQLKSAIRDLGPISLDSIEEYAALKERHDFLAVQVADVSESMAKLNAIIDELTAEMEQAFTHGIDQISVGFERVFKQMFGGGTASLRLCDPSDVLNSTIEIEAQPPGKKLTSLTLMSLGEKTLTAISLLFAMLHTRPSPFILLDEIEAPLDHTNNLKFARFIRSLTDGTQASDTAEPTTPLVAGQSQFILITHKRPTMEAANNIYGITMNDGVTGVVHMELEQ